MKLNPKRRPRSEADVRRAWDDGVKRGSDFASVIFMSVLLDKFGFDHDGIIAVYKAVMKLSEEIAERRVSIADLQRVLLEEYQIKT